MARVGWASVGWSGSGIANAVLMVVVVVLGLTPSDSTSCLMDVLNLAGVNHPDRAKIIGQLSGGYWNELRSTGLLQHMLKSRTPDLDLAPRCPRSYSEAHGG